MLRYETGSTKDGLAGSEGAFLACSFQLVDNLILRGRLRERAQCASVCWLRGRTVNGDEHGLAGGEAAAHC